MTSILKIDEVGQKFVTQFTLFLTWYDFRLNFYNMKTNINMNTLTTRERGDIWVPKLVFSNTESKENTKNDDKSFTVAKRSSSYTYSETDIHENILIFSGSENPLVMSRSYDVEWICDFDMRWYPFDTQVLSSISTYNMI